jgi:hypothetical protein
MFNHDSSTAGMIKNLWAGGSLEFATTKLSLFMHRKFPANEQISNNNPACWFCGWKKSTNSPALSSLAVNSTLDERVFDCINFVCDKIKNKIFKWKKCLVYAIPY